MTKLIKFVRNGQDITCTRCNGQGVETISKMETNSSGTKTTEIKADCPHCLGRGYIEPRDIYTYYSRGPLAEFEGFGVRREDLLDEARLEG